jgi:hypothetical protein
MSDEQLREGLRAFAIVILDRFNPIAPLAVFQKNFGFPNGVTSARMRSLDPHWKSSTHLSITGGRVSSTLFASRVLTYQIPHGVFLTLEIGPVTD